MTNEIRIGTSRVRLLERYDAVLFPIHVPTLLQLLPEAGWVVPKIQWERDDSFSLSEAPSKGMARLMTDSNNKLLGVIGVDFDEVIPAFRELRELVEREFEFPPEVRTMYAELNFSGWARSTENPASALSDWWKAHSSISELSGELGERLGPGIGDFMQYGLRLAPDGLDANRANWAELSLGPQNIAGSHVYHVDLLFRNEDPNVTLEVAESATETIKWLINKLETN